MEASCEQQQQQQQEKKAGTPKPAPATTSTTSSSGGVHLILLHHGLWGSPSAMRRLEHYMEQVLLQQEQQQEQQGQQQGQQQEQHTSTTPSATSVRLLNIAVNEGNRTYDGIDVCGSRVVDLVLEALDEAEAAGTPVTALSCIGYSLGGLILRYAVGKLCVLGVLGGAGDSRAVACLNFVSIATPHLGSWRQPSSWLARFFNSNVPLVASRTGCQVMCLDQDYSVPWLVAQQQRHDGWAHGGATKSTATGQHQQDPQQQQEQQPPPRPDVALPPGVSGDPDQPVPLLLLMAHPAGPFHAALAAFRTRLLVANIHHDTMVPYCTSALTLTNPYDTRQAVSVDPERYPSVVRPAGPADEPGAVIDATPRGRTKRLVLMAAFSPLAPLFITACVAQGLLHHRWARQQPLEGATWLHQHTPAAAAAVAGLSTDAAVGSSSSSTGVHHVDAADLAAARQHARDEEQRDALSRQYSSRQQQQQQDGGGPEAAAIRSPAVTVDEDGVVEAPAQLHAQQLWMAQQLFDRMPPCVVPHARGCRCCGGGGGDDAAGASSLKVTRSAGWQRVDVCTGHYHAHAAIIIRDSRFEAQSRDVFAFIVDHLSGV